MNMTSTTRGPCVRCSALTELSSSGCIFRTSNCQTYNNYGRCSQCIQGYVEVRRLCLPIAQNCQTYQSLDQSKCQVCNQGYHILNSQCWANLEGCLAYNANNLCTRCSAEYQLINGNCVFFDANCLAQDINGLCLGCNNGYLPFKGRCVFFHPFCLNYHPINLNCIEVAGGFSISSGFSLAQQLAYINFVKQAENANSNAAGGDFVGGAGQGSFSRRGLIYWLPFAGLSHSTILRFNFNGLVSDCASGYTLFNGQCVVQTQNCQVYNQYGQC